jgi:hypothetical protein
MHFEDLWQKCEDFHSKDLIGSDIESLINELTIKLNFYKGIDLKPEISKEDKETSKSLLLGEILLTITNISLKDNINVFAALNTALNLKK